MSTVAEAREPSEVPTFSECVIGYRAWRADERLQLWPLHVARRPWVPGVNTARCECRSPGCLRFEWSWRDGRRVLEPAPEHLAPQEACVCGLYSLRRPRSVWREPPASRAWSVVGMPLRVVGAVASWGHLQVHDAGFRAEHACIVTLAHHPKAAPEEMAALRQIAARYGVELVPLDRLEQEASRHGSPLPDRLRPVPSDRTPERAREDALATSAMHAELTPRAQPHVGSVDSHAPAASPSKRIAQAAALGLLGLVSLAIGLLSLAHPVAQWAGQEHRSGLPSIWGVGFLVIPIALVGFGVRRAWWDLSIDREAWRERRRRRAGRRAAGRSS